MKKQRLEAFSDGVLAIIITIMVLQLKAPREATLDGLLPTVPDVLSYLLSFVFLGIYWNNHHRLCQGISRVNGRALRANLHLLFWLSLIPFVTAWVGENHFQAVPASLYGVVLLLAAIAYFILAKSLVALHGKDSVIATALGADFKGKISVVIYAVAIPLAFVESWIAFALYRMVALLWLVPDQRIEKILADQRVETKNSFLLFNIVKQFQAV
jgi:uncharacterized membrane protein